MKKYQVEIVEKIVFQVSVEAANEAEAENMARDQYDKGILEGNGEKESVTFEDFLKNYFFKWTQL